MVWASHTMDRREVFLNHLSGRISGNFSSSEYRQKVARDEAAADALNLAADAGDGERVWDRA